MAPRPRVQATVHTPSRQPFGSALTLAASWVPTLAAQFGRVAPVPDCGEDLMEAPGVGAADQLFHSQGLHWRNRSRSGGGNDSRRKCGHRKRAGCNHQRHRVPTRNAVELTRNQRPPPTASGNPNPGSSPANTRLDIHPRISCATFACFAPSAIRMPICRAGDRSDGECRDTG